MSISGKKRRHDEQALPPEDLPLVITSIKPQKRDPTRSSLYHEDRFLLGLSETVRQEAAITVGTRLTRELWAHLVRSEERRFIRDKLLMLLGRRDHTRTELDRKLKQRGADPDLLQEELDWLDERGYLNHRDFASRFVRDKLQLRGWGPVKIRGELIKRGVSKEIADTTLEDEVRTLDLPAICVDLALKRRQHFLREENPFARRQKIAAWLQRKGYSRDQIMTAIPEILERLDEQTRHR